MMATAEVLPQIEAQILAADMERTCGDLEKEKESHALVNKLRFL